MAKVSKERHRSDPQNRKEHSYSVSSRCLKVSGDVNHKKESSRAMKKEWEGTTCSICMEHPHNAVLLLCSSYVKGCRPYMCATSYRHSNCLEQYKKAYVKVTDPWCAESFEGVTNDIHSISSVGCSDVKMGTTQFLCPLCRGQVKGWTVVEPARKYLNSKRRTCMQDKCSFVGTYRELRKHVKVDHPLAHPREIDPALVDKWKELENERELNDVFSTIRSTMPGAIVMGDYVLEMPIRGFPRDYFDNAVIDNYPTGEFDEDLHSLDEADFRVQPAGRFAASIRRGNYYSQGSWFRNRVLLGRSRQRWRRRGTNRV